MDKFRIAIPEFALVAMIMFLYERFGDPGIVLICAVMTAVTVTKKGGRSDAA